MDESDTLLSHLVSRFPGNAENIATEALAYILNESPSCREALGNLLMEGGVDVGPIDSVNTQVTGPGGVIPDLIGLYKGKYKPLLIEAKFDADLTDNQPNGYLEWLSTYDKPSVLLFVVPGIRVKYWWPELERRAAGKYGTLTHINAERKCLRVGDSERHLMMISWLNLLDSMSSLSRNNGEGLTIEADIKQLRGLARRRSAEVFQPFDQLVELDSALGQRRELDLKKIILEVTEQGKAGKLLNTYRLNVARHPYGFGRYIRLTESGAVPWFGINREFHKKYRLTPLWLWFGPATEGKENYLNQSQHYAVQTELGCPIEDARVREDGWVPLTLRPDVEFSEVLADLVGQLERIRDVIDRAQ